MKLLNLKTIIIISLIVYGLCSLQTLFSKEIYSIGLKDSLGTHYTPDEERYIDRALSKGEEYMRNYLSCDSTAHRLDSLNKDLYLRYQILKNEYDNKPKEVTKNNWFTTLTTVVVVEIINIILLIILL